MGQSLHDPPSVEGWHTGREWIDGGTLVHRINFTADFLGDTEYPGIQEIISRLSADAPSISPEELVDGSLRLLGHYELADENRRMLISKVEKNGQMTTGTPEFSEQVAEMLQLIASTKEYLYA